MRTRVQEPPGDRFLHLRLICALDISKNMNNFNLKGILTQYIWRLRNFVRFSVLKDKIWYVLQYILHPYWPWPRWFVSFIGRGQGQGQTGIMETNCIRKSYFSHCCTAFGFGEKKLTDVRLKEPTKFLPQHFLNHEEHWKRSIHSNYIPAQSVQGNPWLYWWLHEGM